MRSQPSELFGGEAPTSDADDPIPKKTQLRSGFVAAVSVVETNAPHDPEPDSEVQAGDSRDILRRRKRCLPVIQ